MRTQGQGFICVLGWVHAVLQPFYRGLYEGLMRQAFLAVGVDVEGMEASQE